MTYRRTRPAFYRRTDAQQERLLASHCVECGSQYPVAADPGACAPLELKSIDTLDQGVRNELIRFRKLDEKGPHFICGDCAACLMDFD